MMSMRNYPGRLLQRDEHLIQLDHEYTLIDQQEKEIWETIKTQGVNSWADRFECQADHYSDQCVLKDVHQDIQWTYQQLDQCADNVAYWALDTKQSRIGICLGNCPQFLAAVIGLAKAGVVAVLFNTREPAYRLTQLAKCTAVTTVLTLPQVNQGHYNLPVISGVVNQDIDALLANKWQGRLDRSHRSHTTLDDTAAIIFTSGTSGPAKAALFSHRRLIGAGVAWALRNRFNESTCCYIPLPLYHGNGLAVAFASCVESGGMAVIRERFSVKHFLVDIRHYQCDSVVYIGELWRYLLSSKEFATDCDTPLTTIFGNGLSKDMWQPVLKRFGVRHVVEHYGATELPAAALTNAFNIPGYCGFIPPGHSDYENVVLVDENHQVVEDGEIGELLFRVAGVKYNGYLNEAYNKEKVIEGLFEENDLWWKSGDKLKRTAQGFFTFIERLDGSYRYKGENISTIEVEQAFYASGMVNEAVVYGSDLAGVQGKAGMASIVPKNDIDDDSVNQLLGFLETRLAPYAIPLILRIMSDNHPVTATLKITKAKLAEDIDQCFDQYPHYIFQDGVYRRHENTGTNPGFLR